MDLKSILAVMGVVWRRGQTVTLPPTLQIFPVADDAPQPGQRTVPEPG